MVSEYKKINIVTCKSILFWKRYY